jgi:DNA gyrase subunit B
MTELLERGHIYIAQPPLYKVTKGKQEHYVKDDKALNDYLLSLALQNTQLFVTPDAPALRSDELEKLCRQYIKVTEMLGKLTHIVPEAVLAAMVDMPALDVDAFQDITLIQQWLDQLTTLLEDEPETYRLLGSTDEQGAIAVHVHTVTYSVERIYSLTQNFFESPEYRNIVMLGEQIKGIIGEEGYIQRGEKRHAVTDFHDVMRWLLTETKRGLGIQRYKGLGEMNPDQLWDTTMNPDSRNLLQVQIEDAVAADEIFTTLMGDQVEPRRDFIEKNALLVANLDA